MLNDAQLVLPERDSKNVSVKRNSSNIKKHADACSLARAPTYHFPRATVSFDERGTIYTRLPLSGKKLKL